MIHWHCEPGLRKPSAGKASLEQITRHVTKHLGPVAMVIHECSSASLPVDILMTAPTPDAPVTRLVTSGMSDRPMAVPRGEGAARYMELVLALPRDWKLDPDSQASVEWNWPVRLIADLARLPHEHATWLGPGHTVPNGHPHRTFAPNTSLCGAVIVCSPFVPVGLHDLKIDQDKTIEFHSVIPVHEDEMHLKLECGTEALLSAFALADVRDVVDPVRPSALAALLPPQWKRGPRPNRPRQ